MDMLHYILEKESVKIKENLAAITQQIGYTNQPQKAHSSRLSFLLCQITAQKHLVFFNTVDGQFFTRPSGKGALTH